MLSELLTEENIRFLPSAPDWREAVRLCAEPLLKSGAILPEYAEAMVRSVEQHGPYIVVDEGLALPHARPEDGAVDAEAFEALKGWMQSMPTGIEGRRQMPLFDLTDEEFRALSDFLLFTGTINTQNWPPNDAG